MDQILNRFSKNVLAFVLISGGILFIILSQPPHSVCDSQMEVVNKSQQRFLFKDPKSQQVTTTRYEVLRDRCKKTNDPGGCFELFQQLRAVTRDLSTLSAQCSSAISGATAYHRALLESADLIAQLAWGDKPPESYGLKKGWLEVSDISLFCRLRERIFVLYGEEEWNGLRERLMRELPGAKDMPRNQVWDLSLFSENCDRYP